MKTYKKADPRSFQLNLSLTHRELEDIKQRAEALGMRPVHFARAVVLHGSAATAQKAVAERQAFRSIHLQLSRLGNNLNQMVRKFHQDHHPLPADLEPLLKDIRGILARVAQ